jgi:hypothetical protein
VGRNQYLLCIQGNGRKAQARAAATQVVKESIGARNKAAASRTTTHT